MLDSEQSTVTLDVGSRQGQMQTVSSKLAVKLETEICKTNDLLPHELACRAKASL